MTPGAQGPGDELATPAPAEKGPSDESLIFMTHMPGVTVPPRPANLVEQDESLKRLSDDLAAKEQAKAEAEAAAQDPDRAKANRRRPGLTGRLMEGAGRGALERTLEAGRKSSSSSGGISQMFHRAETRSVAGVAGRPQTDPFIPQLPAALLQPFRMGSLSALAGGAAMLAVAAILLELSPLVGFLALAVTLIELSALRLRCVRELARSHDALSWPDVGEVLSAIPTSIVLFLLWLGPAAAVGSLALPASAWDANEPGGLRARIERVWRPPAWAPETLPGDVKPPEPLGRQTLLRVEALIGDVHGDDGRTSTAVAHDLREGAVSRLRRLIIPPEPSAAGIAARVLLAGGLFLFPMALLAAAVLRSVYAAAHLPLLLRAILRAPGAYLIVALGLGGADLALLLFAIAGAPPLHGVLGPVLGHLAWGVGLALLAAFLLVSTSALLGRFYRSYAPDLAWE